MTEYSEKTMIGRIGFLAETYPDAVALVDEGGSLTYRELDRQSNAFAHQVAAAKPAGDAYVVLMLPRTRLFLVAALGTLKAGCTYVVVNPLYPDDRIKTILQETHPLRFVTTTDMWVRRGKALGVADAVVMKVDELPLAELDAEPIDLSTPDQESFVLYTSGTTGKPKGVVHTMQILNSIAEKSKVCPPDSDEAVRCAVVADMAFIATVRSIYDCLANGGECHILGDEMRYDMKRLAAFLDVQRITTAFLGASLGVKMLTGFDLKVKNIRFGGEKVSGMTPEAAAKGRVINVYGMTEISPLTTHVITGYEEPVPAGFPTPGVTLYVLDDDLRKVPDGTIGNIYARSRQMAKCYLAMPEATAERFVADPFEPGKRLVRTGDRGFINPDGELVLCGRIDNMVKLRGLRIETGEIEVVAQTFPGIGSCACVVRTVNGADQLCLYFEGPESLDRAALKDHIAKKVTVYMVPSVFVRVSALPRNDRGKIDRKLLPEPLATFQPACVPPESDNEKALYELAAKILNSRGFGVTDDLFALGMSSLQAMEMVVQAAKEGLTLKASDVMRDKTIRAIVHRRTSMVWWYAPYDPSKDVAVFVHGIALTKNILQKLEMWNERFNVLVVEPIQEHYGYLFSEDGIGEVVELYHALIDYWMPKGARIRVMTGVSFGGKLAYLLACRWRDDTGDRPAVVMGDALLTRFPSLEEAVLNGTVAAWEAEHRMQLGESFIRRLTIITRIRQHGETIPSYDGKTVLLHAVKSVFPGDNAAEWRKYATNLTVIPLEFMHDVISLDREETMPFWRKVAAEI